MRPKGFNDLDVAVFVDEDCVKSKENLFKYELQFTARTDLALPRYTTDLRLLNTAPLSFRYRVIRTGILLFSNDETKRIAFGTKTRSFFFDFEPAFRQRFCNVGVVKFRFESFEFHFKIGRQNFMVEQVQRAFRQNSLDKNLDCIKKNLGKTQYLPRRKRHLSP